MNTTLFTVFNAYALRPSPSAIRTGFTSSRLGKRDGAGRFLTLSEYESLRKERGVFSDVLAFDNLAADLAGRTVFVQLVTDNYFPMVGVGVELGRPLLPGDGPAMVLSYDAWRNKFGSDPSIVGRKLYMRGQPFEVVGVTNRNSRAWKAFLPRCGRPWHVRL